MYVIYFFRHHQCHYWPRSSTEPAYSYKPTIPPSHTRQHSRDVTSFQQTAKSYTCIICIPGSNLLYVKFYIYSILYAIISLSYSYLHISRLWKINISSFSSFNLSLWKDLYYEVIYLMWNKLLLHSMMPEQATGKLLLRFLFSYKPRTVTVMRQENQTNAKPQEVKVTIK